MKNCVNNLINIKNNFFIYNNLKCNSCGYEIKYDNYNEVKGLCKIFMKSVNMVADLPNKQNNYNEDLD